MENSIHHDDDEGGNLMEPLETCYEEDIAHEETIGLEDDGEYIEVDGEYAHHLTDEYTVEDQNEEQEEQDDLDLPESTATALLPMKNGRPILSMNLPDLMSRQISMDNGKTIFMCFSKRCTPQLAFDGYIYNINGTVSDAGYNIWRCSNDNCPGAVRTAPHFGHLKFPSDHGQNCLADDLQVRLRIYVYDLRLMAEFTEIDLFSLYKAFIDKVSNEQPDLISIFPPFDSLRLTLEHHRAQLIYRKRFEIRKLSQMRREQGISHMAPRRTNSQAFKRTKAFPTSICAECNAHLPSSELVPSQDILIEHITFQHERPLVIERYQFPDIALFEQWIRELQQHSRYRLKKMGLYDEHMYYLCQADDRQQRSNHGKNGLINMQCSAFVRVHDWRYLIRREAARPVVVDYCLDHTFHSGTSPLPDACRSPVYDYYSPEVFIRELDERKARTSRLLSSNENLQHIKRIAYQQTPTTAQMVTVPAGAARIRYRPVNPNIEQNDLLDNQGTSSTYVNGTRNAAVKHIDPNSHGSQHNEQRNDFESDPSFDTVMQLEMQCDVIKQRMQNCRRPEVARKYLVRVTALLDDILADPQCAPRRSEIPAAESSHPAERRERAYLEYEERQVPTSLYIWNQPSSLYNMKATSKTSVTFGDPQPSTSHSNTVKQMFLKRGPNGELIVVKRIFRRVPKVESLDESEPVQVDDDTDEIPEEAYIENNESEEVQDQIVEEQLLSEPTLSHVSAMAETELAENLLEEEEEEEEQDVSESREPIDDEEKGSSHLEENTSTAQNNNSKRSFVKEEICTTTQGRQIKRPRRYL